MTEDRVPQHLGGDSAVHRQGEDVDDLGRTRTKQMGAEDPARLRLDENLVGGGALVDAPGGVPLAGLGVLHLEEEPRVVASSSSIPTRAMAGRVKTTLGTRG